MTNATANLTAFKIEKGVGIPSPRAFYPFDEMEVGDSFLFPKETRRKVENAAWQYGRLKGKKFSVRRDGDACRIWRVS